MPEVPRCARCGLRLGAAADRCGACLRVPPPFERTVCVADYGFPWDHLITACKFESRVELSDLLSRALGGAAARSPGDRPNLLVPVPLSPARLAERGFNQAWELARRLGQAMQIAARHDVLLRPADTAHQAELTRAERQNNLRRAFMVDPRQRGAVHGVRVALIDDVMTTGATAAEAAAALLRAGAGAVDVWVVARTPAPA
jgi:ComF family protein